MAPASKAALLVLLAMLMASSTCVAVPVDWQQAVEEGNMLYSATVPEPGYFPYVGNGYIATEMTTDFMFLAGVFNGLSDVTPSHRAFIPSTVDLFIPTGSNPGAQFVGAALDIEHAAFYNRTKLTHCGGMVVQQKWYAHRSRRHVMVYEVTAVDAGTSSGPCKVFLDGPFNSTSADFVTSRSGCDESLCVWNGTSTLAELPGLRLRDVAVAYQSPRGSYLEVSTKQTHRFLTVAYSDLDASPDTPMLLARVELEELLGLSSEAMWAEHTQAWAGVWQSGIEISGNLTVAASVNSSLYYIYSSVRKDWPYGLSPDHGHSFWDTETWQYPPLLLLNPGIAGSLLDYRFNRIHQALLRGTQYGFAGAMWPWESAFTGCDCVPEGDPEGRYEQHITGDIVVAFRQYWYATGNRTWLESTALPVVDPSCTFFQCRASIAPEHASIAEAALAALPEDERMAWLSSSSLGPHCGTKAPAGNYTMLNVQPPDESAGVVNSSAYTNGVMTASLRFCVDAHKALGLQYPSEWSDIASRPYLPLVLGLDPSGPTHPEFTGYKKGEMINQADVALLTYPLNFPMPTQVAYDDLTYYSTVTRTNGYFTGDSSYSIAWLGLGNYTNAQPWLEAAYQHMDLDHFYVWKERAITGGHLNFITGAGGYLQNFVYGYAQIRLASPLRLDISREPVLPPNGVDSLKLRSISLGGHRFSLQYNATSVCLQLTAPPTSGGVQVCRLGAPSSSSSCWDLGMDVKCQASAPFSIVSV